MSKKTSELFAKMRAEEPARRGKAADDAVAAGNRFRMVQWWEHRAEPPPQYFPTLATAEGARDQLIDANRAIRTSIEPTSWRLLIVDLEEFREEAWHKIPESEKACDFEYTYESEARTKAAGREVEMIRAKRERGL
jgi:hypothetical protein